MIHRECVQQLSLQPSPGTLGEIDKVIIEANNCRVRRGEEGVGGRSRTRRVWSSHGRASELSGLQRMLHPAGSGCCCPPWLQVKDAASLPPHQSLLPVRSRLSSLDRPGPALPRGWGKMLQACLSRRLSEGKASPDTDSSVIKPGSLQPGVSTDTKAAQVCWAGDGKGKGRERAVPPEVLTGENALQPCGRTA